MKFGYGDLPESSFDFVCLLNKLFILVKPFELLFSRVSELKISFSFERYNNILGGTGFFSINLNLAFKHVISHILVFVHVVRNFVGLIIQDLNERFLRR